MRKLFAAIVACGLAFAFVVGGTVFFIFPTGDQTAIGAPFIDGLGIGGGNIGCRPEDYKVTPAQVVQWAIDAGWPAVTSADRTDLAMVSSLPGPESCYDPARMGDNYVIRGLLCQSWGLVQVRSCPDNPDPRHLDRGRPEWLVDPVNNLRVALRLRLSPIGWNHWSTYQSGKYLPFTTDAIAAVSTVLGPV